MLRKFQKGQSPLEYTMILIVLMGAFLAGGVYFKRGVQGRWKEVSDGLGDQYDPRFGNGSVRSTLLSETETRVEVIDAGDDKYQTTREDTGTTLEIKSGSLATGAY